MMDDGGRSVVVFGDLVFKGLSSGYLLCVIEMCT